MVCVVGGGEGLGVADKITCSTYNYYIQEVWKLQNSNSSSAQVVGVQWGAIEYICPIDFLPHAKHLSAVDKSAFTFFLVGLHGHVHSYILVLTYKHSSVSWPISNSLVVFSWRILTVMH